MGLGGWIEVGRMDELGRLDSPVHRVHAQAKTVTTGLFVVAVMSFARDEVSALTPFFLYPLALMALGKIPPGYLVRKVLMAAPFAIAVGMFNPVFDRQPAFAIGALTVSGGWLSFASILLRFALTVSAAMVLVACTGMHRLCAGLERMGLPRILTVQLLFLYRYVFVVGAEGSRMVRSVELRASLTRALRFRVYGSLVGNLLLRSMARADRIYRAMLARGFDGEIRVLRPARFRLSDLAFVCGWAAFFAAARFWNLAGLLGSLLTKGVS